MNARPFLRMQAGEETAAAGGAAASEQGRTARASAKEILESGRAIDAQISVLLSDISRLSRWRNIAWGASREIAEERLDALRREALAQMEALKKRRGALSALIEQVENADIRRVLALRCLTYKTWLQIGMLLNMDESTARRKYRQGLEMLDAALQAGIQSRSEQSEERKNRA